MEATVKIAKLTIGSTEYANNGFIPPKFTCDGENVNPAITIENIPNGTKSMAIIVDDPDAPYGKFNHWIIWNIRPKEMIIENTVRGTERKNSFGKTRYQGPSPPEGKAHRYFFKLYALDSLLEIKAGSDKMTVEKAMNQHILTEGEIVCLYQKSSRAHIET